MRWFIGVLLLANLAIFAWSALHEPSPKPALLVEPGVGNIRLLREVEPERQSADEGAQGMAETRAAEAPAVIDVAPESEPEQAEPIMEVVVPESPTVAAAPEPSVAKATTPVCGRLGDFADSAAAQKILALLKNHQVTASLGSESSEQVSGFWVLIPASKDREAGKTKVAELKAAGVKDVWLFAKGPLKNAISLGLFSSEANAGRRVKQVEKAGFKPVIQPKISETARFWLDYFSPSGASVLALNLPGGDQLKDQPHECP